MGGCQNRKNNKEEEPHETNHLVDPVVAAHHGPNTGLHSPFERRGVHLHQSPFIHVLADATTVRFLVVGDVVLGVGNHTLALDALDGGLHQRVPQERVFSTVWLVGRRKKHVLCETSVQGVDGHTRRNTTDLRRVLKRTLGRKQTQ